MGLGGTQRTHLHTHTYKHLASQRVNERERGQIRERVRVSETTK